MNETEARGKYETQPESKRPSRHISVREVQSPRNLLRNLFRCAAVDLRRRYSSRGSHALLGADLR